MWCDRLAAYSEGVCGRYALAIDVAQLVREFDVDISVVEQWLPNYNIAPSMSACIIRQVEDGARLLDLATWGLIPSWAKDPAIASKLTNARSETAETKPSFRRAVAKRRCLVPAGGYYEWYRPTKSPFYIHAADGTTLAMAGLYELWSDPTNPEAPIRQTFTILTREPRAEISMIHDRMPVLLPKSEWSRWLNPETPSEKVTELLDPNGEAQLRVGPLDAFPVSRMVNAVRNNGPALVEPVQEESEGLW